MIYCNTPKFYIVLCANKSCHSELCPQYKNVNKKENAILPLLPSAVQTRVRQQQNNFMEGFVLV